MERLAARSRALRSALSGEKIDELEFSRTANRMGAEDSGIASEGHTSGCFFRILIKREFCDFLKFHSDAITRAAVLCGPYETGSVAP